MLGFPVPCRSKYACGGPQSAPVHFAARQVPFYQCLPSIYLYGYRKKLKMRRTSWLSPGRSTCFVACCKLGLIDCMAYVGRLRLSGLKSELVKDRYVVLCTVTMSSPKRKTKQKKPTHQKQPKHRNTKHKNTAQTNQKTTHTNKTAT